MKYRRKKKVLLSLYNILHYMNKNYIEIKENYNVNAKKLAYLNFW